jgi:hypothetical protein
MLDHGRGRTRRMEDPGNTAPRGAPANLTAPGAGHSSTWQHHFCLRHRNSRAVLPDPHIPRPGVRPLPAPRAPPADSRDGRQRTVLRPDSSSLQPGATINPPTTRSESVSRRPRRRPLRRGRSRPRSQSRARQSVGGYAVWSNGADKRSVARCGLHRIGHGAHPRAADGMACRE